MSKKTKTRELWVTNRDKKKSNTKAMGANNILPFICRPGVIRPVPQRGSFFLRSHDTLMAIKIATLGSFSSVQFSSVAQSCPILCDPMNRSTPGLPVHHQLPESTQTHVHRVGDAIQPSHPLSSSSPPAPNLSQHQGLFKWVSSSHQVTKVLEFQLQHQSFQWTPRTDLL